MGNLFRLDCSIMKFNNLFLLERNTLNYISSIKSKDESTFVVLGEIYVGCMEISSKSSSTSNCSYPTLFHIDSVLSISLEISSGE
jgi:hypothetical protein